MGVNYMKATLCALVAGASFALGCESDKSKGDSIGEEQICGEDFGLSAYDTEGNGAFIYKIRVQDQYGPEESNPAEPTIIGKKMAGVEAESPSWSGGWVVFAKKIYKEYCGQFGNYGYEIVKIPIDGSTSIQLTNEDETDDYAPSFSPDGKKIAHLRAANCGYSYGKGNMIIIDTDGNQLVEIAKTEEIDGYTFERNFTRPSWSHDSQMIIAGYGGIASGIAKMNADGSDFAIIATAEKLRKGLCSGGDFEVAWSPTGQIVYGVCGELFQMNEDGTNIKQLELPVGKKDSPAFSPSGALLAYILRSEEEFGEYITEYGHCINHAVYNSDISTAETKKCFELKATNLCSASDLTWVK